MMDIKKRIVDFIIEEICPEAGIEISHINDDDPLLELGILDSLGILKLISFMDEELDIDISADEINPDNFETLNIIYERIVDEK